MPQDVIIRMAYEAGGYRRWFSDPSREGFVFYTANELERFAALIAAYEREVCAKLADGFDNTDGFRVAAAIRERSANARARGEK